MSRWEEMKKDGPASASIAIAFMFSAMIEQAFHMEFTQRSRREFMMNMSPDIESWLNAPMEVSDGRD